MSAFARRFIASCIQTWPWLAVFILSAILLTQRGESPYVVAYPDGWTLPIADAVNLVMDGVVDWMRGLGRAISGGLGIAVSAVQSLLIEAPWVLPFSLFALIAWQGGGRRLALLACVILLYVLGSGYWIPAMRTLSLVLVALPLAVLIGFAIGYLGFRSARARRVIMPMLDLMQTVPPFAYLIPILLLFGFGPVVGLIASVVFAIPPMVRNTILGMQSIPPVIMESARMSGCSRRQQFAWVELPTALPQMLIGVNQTTMATLSMVIIAAIIGGFDDIGWAVLSAMRKAQFGQSLLSGAVIVLLAILLDRVSAAYAARQLPTASYSGLPAGRFVAVLVVVLGTALLAAQLFPAFREWPASLIYSPAQAINDATTQFIRTYGDLMAALKNTIQFFLLLPVKLGLERAIVPFTWGMTFTPEMKTVYWVLTLASCAVAFGFARWKIGVTVLVSAGVIYFGTTGLPWITVLLLLTLAAYKVGGARLALFSASSVAFLLVTGLWEQAMISVYLCSVAVFLCIAFGGMIGIWAASSDAVSGIIRPINDTLQTLPQFVLLIPALMLFQVGDFTALLAIIAYAIVPMIRYTEQGLRMVPKTLIDVGRSCGCSNWQLFWQVRVPQSLPQVLIGINQTILYALGMLAIAALVGTTGLGQAIFVALGQANAGAGLVAGLGMALIAMTTDRILQAVIPRRGPANRPGVQRESDLQNQHE
ncbi:MAG: ABC transporter permease subunit [Mesorhizobium sp.]|nr:ABC transporter permease subunit [Mesorhizobium sp.]